MISIFRSRTLLGLNVSVVSGSRPILRLTPPRSYSLSSYGGENQNISGKSSEPNSRQTKEREHPGKHLSRRSAPSNIHTNQQPGPPPPNVSEASPSSGSQARPPPSSAESDSQPASSEPGPSQGHPTAHPPSNEAHPTLTDGRASPYVDDDGNLRPEVPEDVKEHNADMADRYDRSYNQISDEGRVEKGFWNKWKRN